MDLKNDQITVGELLDDPAARRVLAKHLGRRMNHPVVNAARTLTLRQALDLASALVSPKSVEAVLRDLRAM